MRILYHYPLCPFSRKIRIALKEKRLEFEPVVEKFWEQDSRLTDFNPSARVPVLVDEEIVVVENQAISEYLEEAYPESSLLGATYQERNETRRIVEWFDLHFFEEVTQNLVYQKALKRHLSRRPPDSGAMRTGLTQIHEHLEYIAWLCERRKWLAGDVFSLADITAAAHLSAVDYLGDVPWEEHLEAKDWYVRIKSRPSFRPLLADYIAALPPVAYYANLDF